MKDEERYNIVSPEDIQLDNSKEVTYEVMQDMLCKVGNNINARLNRDIYDTEAINLALKFMKDQNVVSPYMTKRDTSRFDMTQALKQIADKRGNDTPKDMQEFMKELDTIEDGVIIEEK